MNRGASIWDQLDPKYRLILCDLWGVVHDGYSLYPGALGRLRQWREQGRAVVLITNAPRTREAVEQHLARIGLPRDAWDELVTGGQAGIDVLTEVNEPVGFVGTPSDRELLQGSGVRIADHDGFHHLACTGVEPGRPEAQSYRGDLAQWAARGVHFHCLNPDRVVIHGGEPMVCAGALADIYEELGGRVTWYGKPYAPIYEHALQIADDPPRDQVLAVGDGLQTDILGAARMGFDAIYVTGGIAEGQGFPADFGSRNGLSDWAPIAVVESLA